MHNWAKEIMECVKSKVGAKGLDNIDREELEELKCWCEVAKNIAEYDYYYHITEAMEKPENKYGANYDENGKFYTPYQPRNAQGEFIKRGYMHEPDLEKYRDMDYGMGRMYYTDRNNMGSSNGNDGNSSSNRGYSESNYDRAMRGYEESKMMNPSAENVQEMEKVFEAFEKDVKELKPKMSSNEKSIARTKLTNMANSLM